MLVQSTYERLPRFGGFALSLPATHAMLAARDQDPSSWSMRGLGECIYTLLIDNIGQPKAKAH